MPRCVCARPILIHKSRARRRRRQSAALAALIVFSTFPRFIFCLPFIFRLCIVLIGLLFRLQLFPPPPQDWGTREEEKTVEKAVELYVTRSSVFHRPPLKMIVIAVLCVCAHRWRHTRWRRRRQWQTTFVCTLICCPNSSFCFLFSCWWWQTRCLSVFDEGKKGQQPSSKPRLYSPPLLMCVVAHTELFPLPPHRLSYSATRSFIYVARLTSH